MKRTIEIFKLNLKDYSIHCRLSQSLSLPVDEWCRLSTVKNAAKPEDN